MAHTVPDVPPTEVFEPPDVIDKKAKVLADKIRDSKHFIAFTGAGISTSAGIPDFRGPEGVWTLKRQGRNPTSRSVSTLQAIPTPTHMALVELQNRGMLKFVVSQNCDGLHRKSGIDPDKIAELHGNSNREYCKNCGKEYIRDFRAVATYEKTVRDHRTGRKCARCGGELHDSIVNFGEPLPAQALQRAFAHAQMADLCLALGSSLTVSPANEIPKVVGERPGATLAICNLQKTPLDHLADIRVHARTDDLMERVMAHLNIPIPPFILRRRLVVGLQTDEKDPTRHTLTVRGVDVDGTPVSFLKSVSINGRTARAEPFVISFRTPGPLEGPLRIELELEFMGHYGEPNLKLVHETSKGGGEVTYLLEYNPSTGEWKTRKEG